MKVLLTSIDNPYVTHIGGKHIHLLLLELGLKKSNVEVTTNYYKSTGFAEKARKGLMLPFSQEWQLKSKLGRAANYLETRTPRVGIDVIHAHDVLSMSAVAKTSLKKVLTLHGYFARENVEFIYGESEREKVFPCLLEIETRGMKDVDHIITVDQRIKEYVVSNYGYPDSKVTVMYNGVDIDTFTPTSKEEQKALKAKYGFSQNDFVVLVPRRLVEKNGVIYAVRAIKSMDDKNVKLVIAGDGPERQSILKEAAIDSRIKFVGTISHDEVASYYKMADLVLIPSVTSHGIQEASSLAMLEGMACGKVVMCSEIGGMREIIQHLKNGVLVEEKAPQDIAKAIKDIRDNPILTSGISVNAREYVLQNHSYLAHAQKTLALYHTVLEG